MNVYGAYLNDLWSGQQATFTEPWSGSSVPIVNRFNQNIYYLGASAGFRPGNWTFFVHGIYAAGTREFQTSGISDTDISAWAAEALARYQIGPGMAALVEGFYATGNDADSEDLNYFPVAQDSEARSIFGNDRTVFFWMNAAQIGYWHNNQIDFSGLWYGRAACEFSPTAWMRMIHELVADRTGLHRLIVDIRKYVLRYRKDTLQYPDRGRISVEGHKKILLALRLKDPGLCERVMRNHIHEAKEDAIRVPLRWSPAGIARACTPKCASARRRGLLLPGEVLILEENLYGDR